MKKMFIPFLVAMITIVISNTGKVEAEGLIPAKDIYFTSNSVLKNEVPKRGFVSTIKSELDYLFPQEYQKKINTNQARLNKAYRVYLDGNLTKTFKTYDQAYNYAHFRKDASVTDKTGTWLWDNEPPFKVILNGRLIEGFATLIDAIDEAKQENGSSVYFRNEKEKVWSGNGLTQPKILDIPIVSQLPELPRGCEVTSLTMLLQSAGISIDKMTLSNNVDKVTYQNSDGTNGNPNEGFVGSITDMSQDGYGVYHAPVERLARSYLGNKAIDVTGYSFDDILNFVQNGMPVWTIANVTFAPLSDSQFTTWQTEDGDVKITWMEHSVVITGFDDSYVYINDPLDGQKNKRISRQSFEQAWEQMGSQAITYVK